MAKKMNKIYNILNEFWDRKVHSHISTLWQQHESYDAV